MAKNAVQYAEDDLGVHTVWTETQERLSTHAGLSQERAELLAYLRSIRSKQADREADLAIDAAATYSELSDTARGRAVKTMIHADPAHRSLRENERECQNRLDVVDANLAHHEKGIVALSARMEQLGGLLRFYAAAKETNKSVSS